MISKANEPGNRMALERQAKKPVLVHPEVMFNPNLDNLCPQFLNRMDIPVFYPAFLLKRSL